MFYVEEAVFSRFHGYGRVIEAGEHPVVRFIGAWEARVDGSLLRIIADDAYDSVLANKITVEQWTHQLVYGEPIRGELFQPLQRVRRPLAERVEEAVRWPPLTIHARGTAGCQPLLPLRW